MLGREKTFSTLLVLIGFSMGGNLVLKLAGEWGNEGPAEFRAVAAVCPAVNLAAGADALHEPANRIYEYYFLAQLFPEISAQSAAFSGCFDASRLRGVRTLRDFDDRVTAYYCGFTGADDYYARSAAANVIDHVAKAYPGDSAVNDPFIRILPEIRHALIFNPNITYIEVDDGGHCAFVGERVGDPIYDGRCGTGGRRIRQAVSLEWLRHGSLSSRAKARDRASRMTRLGTTIRRELSSREPDARTTPPHPLLVL